MDTLLGELQWHFLPYISSQLQNAWVVSCWTLPRQKWRRLLLVDWNSRQLQKVCEDKLWENSWVETQGKRMQAESLQQNIQNKPVGREKAFLLTFLNYHVEQFSVLIFRVSFWKSWRCSPSIRRYRPTNKKIIILAHSMTTAKSLIFKRIETISLIWPRCDWLWNWNLSRVVLRMLQYQRSKKKLSTNKSQKRIEETEVEREALVPLFTHVSNNLQSVFFQSWGVHQQSANWQL